MTNGEPLPRLDDLLELRHQAHTLGLASHHLVNSAFSGVYASVFRGQGLNFEEVREYREGDDIRNMDWKVTARTDEPHLKVYREERERSVVLCVDHGPHMHFGTRGTFKYVQATRATALLGWAANGHDDRVKRTNRQRVQRHEPECDDRDRCFQHIGGQHIATAYRQVPDDGERAQNRNIDHAAGQPDRSNGGTAGQQKKKSPDRNKGERGDRRRGDLIEETGSNDPSRHRHDQHK